MIAQKPTSGAAFFNTDGIQVEFRGVGDKTTRKIQTKRKTQAEGIDRGKPSGEQHKRRTLRLIFVYIIVIIHTFHNYCSTLIIVGNESGLKEAVGILCTGLSSNTSEGKDWKRVLSHSLLNSLQCVLDITTVLREHHPSLIDYCKLSMEKYLNYDLKNREYTVKSSLPLLILRLLLSHYGAITACR